MFTANVANGWVQATVTFGHPTLAMDGLAIRNADASQYDDVAQNLSTGAGQSSHATVNVLVTDGTLDLRFEDLFNSQKIAISSIDIRPAELFSIGFSDAPSSALSADGSTIDTFTVAAGQYDLLTAVVHELGHAIGLAHSEDGVMAPVFNPGERATEIDAFFASDLGHLLG